MGGAWKQLIRTIEVSLYSILKDQCPDEEVLVSVYAQIENIVHSRPITKLSTDPQYGEALTPNHFLIGASSGNVHFYANENQCKNLRSQWQIAQYFLNNFWKRWLREHLLNSSPSQVD